MRSILSCIIVSGLVVSVPARAIQLSVGGSASSTSTDSPGGTVHTTTTSGSVGVSGQVGRDGPRITVRGSHSESRTSTPQGSSRTTGDTVTVTASWEL